MGLENGFSFSLSLNLDFLMESLSLDSRFSFYLNEDWNKDSTGLSWWWLTDIEADISIFWLNAESCLKLIYNLSLIFAVSVCKWDWFAAPLTYIESRILPIKFVFSLLSFYVLLLLLGDAFLDCFTGELKSTMIFSLFSIISYFVYFLSIFLFLFIIL